MSYPNNFKITSSIIKVIDFIILLSLSPLVEKDQSSENEKYRAFRI